MLKTKKQLTQQQVCEHIALLSTADQLSVKSFLDKTLEQKAKDAEAEYKLIKEKS